MVVIYDRKAEVLREEEEYQQGLVSWLYESRLGRWFLPPLTAPFLSDILRLWDYTPFSWGKAKTLMARYQIDLDHFEPLAAKTFVHFFTRVVKPAYRPQVGGDEVMAVADAKLLAYEITEDLKLTIKGQTYALGQLLADDALAQTFQGGTALVYRLGVEDYHRYLACETGEILTERHLSGKLHTVRELAQKRYPVFKENKRCYQVIETATVGAVVQMEIGALLVGRFYNHPASRLVRGQEKGHFGLGGSTIMVLYPQGAIQMDETIWSYSQENIETQVYQGEGVGHYVATSKHLL